MSASGAKRSAQQAGSEQTPRKRSAQQAGSEQTPRKRSAQRGPASLGLAGAERSSGLGLFGGTFNPVHLGHLRAADEVREALGLRKVIFVPSADPPFKRDGTDPLADARQRMRWVESAVADNPAFAVDGLELEREGPSYTVDTLRIFAERLAPERPVFIIGSDAFAELPLWREPEALLTLASFAVMTRPGLPTSSAAGWLPQPLEEAFTLSDDGQGARHREGPTWVRRIPITALDISSTDVRRRLSEGRSVRYLLPESILEDVTKSGVYDARSIS
jgi:nicotinate-nucleotide adenylyltransferase